MAGNEASLYSGLKPPARRELDKKLQEDTKPDPKAEDVLLIIADMKNKVASTADLLVDDSMIPEAKMRKMERRIDEYKLLNELDGRFRKLLGLKPERGKS